MPKPALLPLLALALLLHAPAVRAQETWVPLIDEQAYTAWVDTASIVRTGDLKFSTWTLWRRGVPAYQKGGLVGSVAEYREYDCGAGRSRLRSIFLLDALGQAIDAREGSALRWEAPPLDSDREVLQDLICILAIHRRSGP